MGIKRSLPIFLVLSLMIFISYTTIFIFLDRWLSLKSSTGILNAAIFSLISFMALISLSIAVFKDPGSVPSNYAPDSEDPQNKQGTKSRHCDKCSTYKPPRTHHCRVCKRCVLKMDHHCVWINNCVGYANYKPFIIFVLHAAVGSIYSMVVFFGFILHKEEDISIQSPRFFYILCGSIIVLLSISTSTLLGWHIYLLSCNMSTIEYREVVRAMWLAKKSGQNYRHKYDLGPYNNLILILGPNILTWICPCALGHLNDGTNFPISND